MELLLCPLAVYSLDGLTLVCQEKSSGARTGLRISPLRVVALAPPAALEVDGLLGMNWLRNFPHIMLHLADWQHPALELHEDPSGLLPCPRQEAARLSFTPVG